MLPYFSNKTSSGRVMSWIKVVGQPVCEIVRWTYVYHSFVKYTGMITYTHNSCHCNEVIALRYRHQVDTPACIYDVDVMKVWLEKLGVGKVDLKSRSQVVNSYAGRWRRRYYAAYVSLKRNPLNRKDFTIQMFVKDDKENGAPEKAPRCIQYRNPRGALAMGQFTHAVEAEVYKAVDQFGTRIFGKGLNLHDLADDLNRKRKLFSNPVYLMLDASKFDSCVDVKMLKLMTWYYKTLVKAQDKSYIQWLWSKTYVNKGFTKHGVRYKTWGTRMSGDMDTGLGNSLIMYACICEFLKQSQISKYAMSVNGDDSVIVIESKDLHLAKAGMTIWRDFGFNMKFDFTTDFNQVEYCQSKPLLTDYGWVMARNPVRLLSRIGFNNTMIPRRRVNDYMYTLGLGEQAASYGVPIGWAIGAKLSGYHGKVLALSRKKYLSYTKQRHWMKGYREPSMEVRHRYETVWGISVSEQLDIESFKFKDYNFDDVFRVYQLTIY